MVTTFTYKPSLVRIDARRFRVIVVTDPQTNKQTNTQTNSGDYNALRRDLARSVTSKAHVMRRVEVE